MKHGQVPSELSETWTEYWLMKDGLMILSYTEFGERDAKWVDDLGIISKIVQQYQESQQHLKGAGATLGNPTGNTIGS